MTRIDLRTGDCLAVLGTMPDGSFDGVLCDPPYGLTKDGKRGFMGHAWDHGVPSAEVWREVLRVLRPGAPLLAFGGTRTFHRLVSAIEDAGFEVKDVLMWLHGQGFPKGKDISKEIDKEAGAKREVVGQYDRYHDGLARNVSDSYHGASTQGAYGANGVADITAAATPEAALWEGYHTQIKPAYEPVVLAMKPLDGTYAHNARVHGVGGLNIDGCRVATDWSERSEAWKRSGHSAKPDAAKIAAPPGTGINCHLAGRFPANVLLDDDAAARALDEQSGVRRAGERPARRAGIGFGGGSDGTRDTRNVLDSGGASRFYYTSKASARERSAGLPDGETNAHPCCKPLDLCRYLATLILPPSTGRPRRLLCPFAGSGSEMIGALQAGWDEVVGIELSAEYVALAKARLAYWQKQPTPARKAPKPAQASAPPPPEGVAAKPTPRARKAPGARPVAKPPGARKQLALFDAAE